MNRFKGTNGNSMKTQKLIVAVLVLQSLTLMNQWCGGPLKVARAQIPDSGAQRNEIIDELKTSNEQLKGISEKLDKMASIFDGGKLQVQIAKPDDKEQK
jgi:hypothetical protein